MHTFRCNCGHTITIDPPSQHAVYVVWDSDVDASIDARRTDVQGFLAALTTGQRDAWSQTPPRELQRYMAEYQSVDIFPTDRMCNVIALARREADGRNAKEICTADILYCIAKEGSGVAAHVLESLNIILAKHATVPWTIESGRSELASLTGEARKLILRAEQKGLLYRKNLSDEWPPFAWYGTEHVLLAMPTEPDETGAQLLLRKLEEAGHTIEDLKNSVSKLLGDVAM